MVSLFQDENASESGPPTFEDIAEDQGDGTYLCTLCNKTVESEERYAPLFRACTRGSSLFSAEDAIVERMSLVCFSMNVHVGFHSADESFLCTECGKGRLTVLTPSFRMQHWSSYLLII